MIRLFIKRELKALWRDKGFLLLAFGGPLFYSIFYPFPYQQDIARNIPVAVVDQDHSYLSRQLVQMMTGEEELYPVGVATVAEAKTALEQRRVFAIAVLEKDLGKNILKGVPQSVAIYTDGSYPIYYKQTTSALQRAVKTMGAGIEIKKLQSLGVGKAANTFRSPIQLTFHNLYSPAGAYRNYLVPAVFVTVAYQIILMVIGLRAGTLKEQKKLYSPHLKPLEIWAGKMLSFLLFLAGYFVFLFLVMFRLYGFSGGTQIVTWFLFYMVFAVATVGLGLTLGLLFQERESSVMFIVVTSLPLVFMSGIIWPVWKMPLIIRILRLCIPLTYGITGVVRLYVMNVSLFSIWPYALGICILAVLFCCTSYYGVKKRYPKQL